MKTQNRKLTAALAALAALSLSAYAQTDISSHFLNLNFNTGPTSFGGGTYFDNPAADILGWNNGTGLTDAGTEGPGAWWGPYDVNAAFINGGGSTYNLSDYTIQTGDAFSISFMAQWWNWTGANGQWTATFFYDNPANVIGSYSTPDLTGGWTAYSTATPIAATAGSVGHQLGILMTSSGTGISQLDFVANAITVSPVPEPATISLAMVAGLGMLLARRRFVK
jgi:hypothetical protein